MQTRREGRDAWHAFASFWPERMGEGNDFVEVLVGPSVRRLLAPLEGLRGRDVGSGNGLYARELAAGGGPIHAADCCVRMIELALAATRDTSVEYDVIDASDPANLDRLPAHGFDAAPSTMVLVDMVDTEPRFRALPRFLVPGGSFVFATAHARTCSCSYQVRPPASHRPNQYTLFTATVFLAGIRGRVRVRVGPEPARVFAGARVG